MADSKRESREVDFVSCNDMDYCCSGKCAKGKAIGKTVAPELNAKAYEYTLHDLSDVPTKELHEELARRESVEEYIVKPHGESARIVISKELCGVIEHIEGPARILVNKD